MFRFTCSVVLWGGRGAADKCHRHVWGALAVFRPHWVCPCSRRVCFPRLHCSGSRLLYRERALNFMHFPGLSRSGSGSGVLHKGAGSVGPAFCAFPGRSSSGIQELEECTLFRCSATSPLPVQPQFLGAPGAVCLVTLLGADLWLRPSQWMSTIQNLRKSLVRNWKPVCSFVGDAVSGAEFAPFRLLPPASGRE